MVKLSSTIRLTVLAIIVIILGSFSTQSDALVTTMINATTTLIQEQWLIYHSLAPYGPENFNSTSVPIIPTQLTLCDEDPSYDFKNRVVLVLRGNCPFFTKSYRAQQYGAIGVVIGNTDDGPLINMSYDKKVNTTEITIPTIMVRNSPFNYLIDMTQHAQPYVYPPVPDNDLDSQNYEGIERIGEALEVTSVQNRHSGLISTPITSQSPLLRLATWPLEGGISPETVDCTEVTDEQGRGDANYASVLTQFGSVRIETSPTISTSTGGNVLSSGASPRPFFGLNFGEMEMPFSVMGGSFGTISPLSLMSPLSTSKPTKSPTKSPKASSFQSLSAESDSPFVTLRDPFDPDDPDAGPFYFLVTIDSRGESTFPYFNLRQIQFFLIVLVLAPLIWILILFIRWLRLYWGFRCVEELVTDAASHLPVCVFIQTNDNGEIIFDSGEGTASNNLADMMKAAEEASGKNNSNDVGDGNGQDGGRGRGGDNVTSSQSNLFSPINNPHSPSNNSPNSLNGGSFFNTKSNRYVVVAPTHELYKLLRDKPTVSNQYVANSLTSPNYTISDTSNQLHFKNKTNNAKDVRNMTYNDVMTQSISSVDAKTHFRVHSDTCNVCLENFVTGDEVSVLGCYHCFHPACINSYFNSHSSGLPGDSQQMDTAARAEQRRMYANMYLASNYEFDELGNDDDQNNGQNGQNGQNGTNFGASSNGTPRPQVQQPASQQHAGQSCPVCRKSILQSSRMNAIIKKKWWIKLFEWICMCSCCCPSWRRRRRQRRREEAAALGPVVVEEDAESGDYNVNNYRYSYEATRQGNLALSRQREQQQNAQSAQNAQNPQNSQNSQNSPSHQHRHSISLSANAPEEDPISPQSNSRAYPGTGRSQGSYGNNANYGTHQENAQNQQNQQNQQSPTTIHDTSGYNPNDYSY